ncbi:MAG: hypothetical protein ACRELY_00575 [Polyangiaceae bacterium]
MERGVVVRGRIHGRRIDLDEPVDQLEGEVEVVVRAVGAPQPTVADMLALIATFPPGTRSKEDIDRQIAEERASWDRD